MSFKSKLVNYFSTEYFFIESFSVLSINVAAITAFKDVVGCSLDKIVHSIFL